VWILLDGVPAKLPEGISTPEGVVKHLADGLKKLTPIAAAALAHREQARALVRKLRFPDPRDLHTLRMLKPKASKGPRPRGEK
jgi:hypothetical protein